LPTKKAKEDPSKTSLEVLRIVVLKDDSTTVELISKGKAEGIRDFVVKAELLNLERAGLVIRKVLDQNDPLNNSSWRLTQSGSEALKVAITARIPAQAISSDRSRDLGEDSEVQVVLTCPPDFKQQFASLDTKESVEILKTLFLGATAEIRIVSPYIDNVIIDRFEHELQALAERGVKLRIIFRDYNTQTQNAIHWLKVIFKENFAWRRIWTPVSGGRGQSARGVHAKFFVIDNETTLISSMNLTVNSINYNIEIGILVHNKTTVEKVIRIFEILWNNAGTTVAI